MTSGKLVTNTSRNSFDYVDINDIPTYCSFPRPSHLYNLWCRHSAGSSRNSGNHRSSFRQDSAPNLHHLFSHNRIVTLDKLHKQEEKKYHASGSYIFDPIPKYWYFSCKMHTFRFNKSHFYQLSVIHFLTWKGVLSFVFYVLLYSYYFIFEF